MSVLDEITEFKRKCLAERLAKITQPQKELFDRVFPGGPRDDQLETAIDLCDRTIAKNEKDPSRFDLELSSQVARRLECVQNGGHYKGVFYPRVIKYRGDCYVLVHDGWPKQGFRKARPSDYATFVTD